VDVLNPLQPECMDINEIKRLYGDRLAFWGGISTQQTLPYGTPDRVRAETRSTILAMGKGGGSIVAPSLTIQEDVPLEIMLALVSEMQASAAAEG
jgi:uroporphyrinogen decarboxylase